LNAVKIENRTGGGSIPVCRLFMKVGQFLVADDTSALLPDRPSKIILFFAD